ncbi:MAG: NUDIX hydrolase [Gammaproteobacteria bacterium]
MNFSDHFFARLQKLPERRTLEFPKAKIPVNYHTAAVLLAFWPGKAGEVEVVFTRRTGTLSSHAGQVSFPGGRVDPADASLQATALREAHEEIGLRPEQARIMGRVDDAWSRYGHHVIPFIGWLEEKPALTPNPEEVAEVIIADVETLMRPENSRQHEVVVNNVSHMTQAFSWEGGYVWGLSADLMLELILWIKDEPSNRGAVRLERMQTYGI